MNPDAKALSADLQILSARITNALAQARLLQRRAVRHQRRHGAHHHRHPNLGGAAVKIEDAVMWIITMLLGIEGYIAVSTAWLERPLVGYDYRVGRYRSVRLMARESRR